MPCSKTTPGGCNCGGVTCSIPRDIPHGGGTVLLPAANLTLAFKPYQGPGVAFGATQSFTLVYDPAGAWDTGWVQATTPFSCSWYRVRIACSGPTATISYAWSSTPSGTLRTGGVGSPCASGGTYDFFCSLPTATTTGPLRSTLTIQYALPFGGGTVSQTGTLNQ